MEPRTHARGNEAPVRPAVHRAVASMEPRTHARGNNMFNWLISRKVSLQWSHALTRVETRRPPEYKCEPEGLQWSHALTRVEICLALRSTAVSYGARMEPHHTTRGTNRTVNTGVEPLVWLQWSHALTRVETLAATALGPYHCVASMEPRTHARGNRKIFG